MVKKASELFGKVKMSGKDLSKHKKMPIGSSIKFPKNLKKGKYTVKYPLNK